MAVRWSSVVGPVAFVPVFVVRQLYGGSMTDHAAFLCLPFYSVAFATIVCLAASWAIAQLELCADARGRSANSSSWAIAQLAAKRTIVAKHRYKTKDKEKQRGQSSNHRTAAERQRPERKPPDRRPRTIELPPAVHRIDLWMICEFVWIRRLIVLSETKAESTPQTVNYLIIIYMDFMFTFLY